MGPARCARTQELQLDEWNRQLQGLCYPDESYLTFLPLFGNNYAKWTLLMSLLPPSVSGTNVQN